MVRIFFAMSQNLPTHTNKAYRSIQTVAMTTRTLIITPATQKEPYDSAQNQQPQSNNNFRSGK